MKCADVARDSNRMVGVICARLLQANYRAIATTHKAIKTSKDKEDKIMPIQCPFIGINIEGRRPLVIERRKYETVTRKINVTSERVEQLPSGSYALVIEHATGNVRGKYRFNDCNDYFRHRYFTPGYESIKAFIEDWAERKRKSLAKPKPKLDARGKLIERLRRTNCEGDNNYLIASLQEAA
jgi:hypothetical protein